jgi:hypothetical protein
MPNPSRYAATVLRISPLCQGFRAHDVIVEANSRTGVPLRVSVSRRGVWLTVIALSLSIVVAVFFAQSGSEKKLLSGLRALDLEVRSEVRQKNLIALGIITITKHPKRAQVGSHERKIQP